MKWKFWEKPSPEELAKRKHEEFLKSWEAKKKANQALRSDFEESAKRKIALNFQRTVKDDSPSVAMDSIDPMPSGTAGAYPLAQLDFFSSFGFIGFQALAIIAQHPIVSKVCSIPAEDAVRKGFEISFNDGEGADPMVSTRIEELNARYELNKNMIEFVRMGRTFGLRLCLFLVDSDLPGYYENPFNIDSIKKGEYKGMVQIDPYWVSPLLDFDATSNPLSKHYYEPTFWTIGSKRIHRSHFVIYRGDEVADILKPTYFYGGVSEPQKIMERLYCAERTANEAPLLALSKRLTTYKVSSEALLSDSLDRNLAEFARLRDNFGVKVFGDGEEINQFDTSLADLDAVIMTQYQLVSAITNIPSTKLLGTTPKGFSSTGEYEEASYHEMLESVQNTHLNQLLERHFALMEKSDLEPEFGKIKISWNWRPLDSVTEKEQAEINNLKMDMYSKAVSMGAILGEDIQKILVADPKSGFSGVEIVDEERSDNSPLADLIEELNA